MCGRMTLTRGDLDEVAGELDAIVEAPLRARFRPRWNVAPTDAHPILHLAAGAEEAAAGAASRRLGLATWGFPRRGPGQSGGLVINARAEGAAGKASFREAFARRRCVVVADGFYEWEKRSDGRQPIWFHRADGGLLLLAGIYEEAPPAPARVEGERDDLLRRFVVLTTTPNALLARVHDRMPVLLDPAAAAAWLAAPDPQLLRPADEGTLVATAVSRRVNAVANDDPACLGSPAEEAGAGGASSRAAAPDEGEGGADRDDEAEAPAPRRGRQLDLF